MNKQLENALLLFFGIPSACVLIYTAYYFVGWPVIVALLVLIWAAFCIGVTS